MSKFDCSCCVVTAREMFRTPAMCCVVEFEDVVVRHYGARLRTLAEASRDCDEQLIIVILLNFAQMRELDPQLARFRRQGKTVVAYVFDGWHLHGALSPLRKLQARISPRHLIGSGFNLLCLPFREPAAEIREQVKADVLHVPLGVDTSLSYGGRADRPVTFLAYGRQPRPLMDRLSREANVKGSPHMLYHTLHVANPFIRDYHAHRRMFWAISERSVFSFAYSGTEVDPNNRFPYSLVGQRWFEAIAAGCVIVGQRPTGEEADELLDWPDATLELDTDPEAALAQLHRWLAEPERLREIGLRNAAKARERHDWTHRLDTMEPAIREILGRRGSSPTLGFAPQRVAARATLRRILG
ncbi:MAG: glycosyltransferase [Amaricoccus sp.]